MGRNNKENLEVLNLEMNDFIVLERLESILMLKLNCFFLFIIKVGSKLFLQSRILARFGVLLFFIFVFNFFSYAEPIKNSTQKNKDTVNLQVSKIEPAIGLFFIFDVFIDDYYLINSYNTSSLALEKSILKNYYDIFELQKFAKDLPIFITVRAPILDYMNTMKILDSNKKLNPKYKSTESENKISENWTLTRKAIDYKLSYEDKLYILNKIKFLPNNFNISDYPKYQDLITKIDYSSIMSTDTVVVTDFIKRLDRNFFIQVLTYYNIFWFDNVTKKDLFISQLLDKATDQIRAKDLQDVMDLKKRSLDKAIAFFIELPSNWNYLVYPYYDPKMDILASNRLSFYMNTFLSEDIDLPYDAVWHVVKSFKSFSSFNKKLPVGIITDLDFVDKNILKVFAVRDYELVFNKGRFQNYMPIVLNKDTKNIYMLFDNIDFNYDIMNSFLDINSLFENFFKDIANLKKTNTDIVFILNSDKLSKLGLDIANDPQKLDGFYSKFLKRLEKSCNFVNLSAYKERIMSNKKDTLNVNLASSTVDSSFSSEKLNFNFTDFIDLNEQEFIIDTDSLVGFLNDDKTKNYWYLIKDIKDKLNSRKTRGDIDDKNYNICMNNIYRAESVLFLNKIYTDKIIAQEFNDIVREIDPTKAMETNVSTSNAFVKLENLEYSKISLFDGDNKNFYLEDSLNDDYGDGNYIYPDNPLYSEGFFDLKALQVFYGKKDIVFKVFMRNLKNSFRSKIGFILPQIDIYIDMNGRKGLGNTTLLADRNAFIVPENAWEYCISVNEKEVVLYSADIDGKLQLIQNLNFKIDLEGDNVSVFVPKEVIDGDIFLWKYIVLTCGYDREKNAVMKGEKVRTKNSFGGRQDDFQSNIIDIIVPDGMTQKDIFKAKNAYSVIKAVELKSDRRSN